MAEYIEREALCAHCGAREINACSDECEVFNAPAADVVARKRGRWVYIGGDEWCCSCCGFVASTEGRWEPMMAKFCEECGADMREVDHEP